jgi:hypothetical protein
VRQGCANGFLAWEKMTLLTVYIVSVVEYPLGSWLHWPLGPVPTVAVLLLAVRRAAIAQHDRAVVISEATAKVAEA